MSELKGCNTEDGEEIKSSQDGGPLDFPLQHLKESGNTGRRSPRGWEVKRRRNFYFYEHCVISNSWSQTLERETAKGRV